MKAIHLRIYFVTLSAPFKHCLGILDLVIYLQISVSHVSFSKLHLKN